MQDVPELGHTFVDSDLTFWEVAAVSQGEDRRFLRMHHGPSVAELDQVSTISRSQFASLSAERDFVRLELDR